MKYKELKKRFEEIEVERNKLAQKLLSAEKEKQDTIKYYQGWLNTHRKYLQEATIRIDELVNENAELVKVVEYQSGLVKFLKSWIEE